MQRHRRTGEWTQWFQESYEENPAAEPTDENEQCLRLLCSAFWQFVSSVVTELLPTTPYWFITLLYVFGEAFPTIVAAVCRDVKAFPTLVKLRKAFPTPAKLRKAFPTLVKLRKAFPTLVKLRKSRGRRKAKVAPGELV